jgi:succinate dehydrogenase/fumarate reductase flavoprotein subunit
MSDWVGPFRSASSLVEALIEITQMREALGVAPPKRLGAFDTRRLDWFDLRNMLLVAQAVADTAFVRRESRGAHQREDFPLLDDDWAVNQTVRLDGDRLRFEP